MNQSLPACILNDTRVDLHHGCQRVMHALFRLLTQAGFHISATYPAHGDWSRDAAFLKAAQSSRLVVVNGEGTIHHDRPAGLKLLEVSAWAHAHDIPAVLINTGWEANGPAFAQLAKLFSLVATRDSASADALRAHGVNARVVPDLSLYEGAAPFQAVRSTHTLFTDSVDRFKALELDRARWRCGGQTLSIVYAHPGLGGYRRFMRESLAKADLPHPARVAALMRMRHRLHRNSSASTDQFMNRLATGALLVSGRFHACTLALCAGTPFVSIPSNTGKISAFIKDAGLEPWRERTPLECGALTEARNKNWSRREAAAIAHYLAVARTGAESLFADIRRLV